MTSKTKVITNNIKLINFLSYQTLKPKAAYKTKPIYGPLGAYGYRKQERERDSPDVKFVCLHYLEDIFCSSEAGNSINFTKIILN